MRLLLLLAAVAQHPVAPRQAEQAPTGRDTAHYSADRPVDFLHLDLDLRFTEEGIAKRRCEGLATYRLKPRAPEVDRLRLDAKNLRIVEVTMPDSDKPLPTSYDDAVLTIELPRAYTPDDEFQISVRYEVAEPQEGMYFVLPNASRPDRPLAVYTMGEPLEARAWMPTHDWPNERFTADFRITVPEGLEAIANGQRVGADTADGATTFHFRHEVPTDPHLLGLAVGEFVEVPGDWRGKPTTVWTQPGLEDAARHTFRRVPEMLDFYEGLIGVSYPYEGYPHATIPAHHHGGMEHAGFSFMDPKFMAASDDGDWPLEQTESTYISHMLAHQWFAGLVNYRSVSEAWLNEGYAILLDSLWTSHADSPHRFGCKMWDMAKGVAAFDSSETGRPMVERRLGSPGEIYQLDGAKVYYKGGWVLNMLRHQLGDELFWRATREYLRRNQFGAVSTADLQRAFEDVSGRDLEQFFQQWVYRHGVPRLKVDYRWSPEGQQATVAVAQTQKIDEATPAFAFPLEIWFEVGESWVKKIVDVRDPRHEFRFKLESEPTMLVVDPQGGLLKTLEVHVPRSLLAPLAERGPTALARLMAVEALAGDPSRANVSLLERVLTDPEQFWMVREAAAEGLGRQQTTPARDALLRAAELPADHPRARAALIAALGRYTADGRAHEALLREAEAEGDARAGLYVELQLASALAHMRGGPERVARGRKWLMRQATGPSRRAVRQRAIAGLGELSEGGSRALWRIAAESPDADDRAEAIRALGRGDRPSDRVVEQLIAWLDDEDESIQSAAASALGQLGENRATGELVRLRDSARGHQVRDSAGRALESLRRPPRPGRSLETVLERMEALEKQNQSLEKKLEAVLEKLDK